MPETLVVWIPMLDSDERSRVPSAAQIFARSGVAQFWDGAQLAGLEVARTIGEPGHAAWDIYLFYGPDARWHGDAMPPPAAALAQMAFQGGGGVVATRGILPARRDAALLPPHLQGRADIVGDHADLPRLLATVATGFAK